MEVDGGIKQMEVSRRWKWMGASSRWKYQIDGSRCECQGIIKCQVGGINGSIKVDDTVVALRRLCFGTHVPNKLADCVKGV